MSEIKGKKSYPAADSICVNIFSFYREQFNIMNAMIIKFLKTVNSNIYAK